MNTHASGARRMRGLVALAAAGALLAGSLGIPAAALAAAPDNDMLATATLITDIPFSASYSLAEATFELGEPTPSCSTTMSQSVWFDYTPATNGLLVVNSGNYYGNIAVYTGGDLASLTRVGCSDGYYWPIYLNASAGVTYHFQITNGYYLDASGTFTLDVAPAPSVSVWLNPYDPSVFDTVSFSASVYDPAYQQLASSAWDFGDGTTASGTSASHRYAADGDYTVSFAAMTVDGRTGTWGGIVPVRTRDVAITKFSVPTIASAGQTRPLTISLANRRGDEWVTVTLMRGTPNGTQALGSQYIFVPARPTRTTSVTFSYTFTRDDAAIGKVTFVAQATIAGGRDALTADNEAIATTKVAR